MTETQSGAQGPKPGAAEMRNREDHHVGADGDAGTDSFIRLLDLLGFDPDEYLSINRREVGTEYLVPAVVTRQQALPLVQRYRGTCDLWLGINPVRRLTAGRGEAKDVTRLATLTADLDYEKLPEGEITAWAIIRELSATVGTPPAAVVETGHGCHPYWPVAGGVIGTPEQRKAAERVLAGWKALVQDLAQRLGGKADSVFDLSRIMRVPGTVNRKTEYPEPVPVRVTFNEDATALDLEHLRLPVVFPEEGVCDRVVAKPERWEWGTGTCPYVRAMVDGWRGDEATGGRHPWLFSKAVRLAAARRSGCITEADHTAAQAVLGGRFAELCQSGIGGPIRDPRPARGDHLSEVEEVLRDAEDRVAHFTQEKLAKELGDHDHAETTLLARLDGADVVLDPDADPARPELGEAVLAFLKRYVAFPSEAAAVAAALWAMHTHVLDAFDTSPRLAALSPEPSSGKTRLLECLEMIIRRGLLSEDASVAAIFRMIEAARPTLLFDEVDAIFGRYGRGEDNESLRGLLNAGHARSGRVIRCEPVGKRIEVKDFDVFAPVALAGLGDLPDTLMSRSVVIRMRKRKREERLAPYRRRRVEPQGHKLRDELAAWGAAAAPELADAWPDMPEGVEDREADCWEPLLAVADLLGGEWPERARDACKTLVGQKQVQASQLSLRVRLLRDLWLVFDNGRTPALHTSDVLDELNALEEAPWRNLAGAPLDALRLARYLGEYDVTSVDMKLSGVVRKGYRREHLWDAWQRYTPDLIEEATGSPSGSASVTAGATRDTPSDQGGSAGSGGSADWARGGQTEIEVAPDPS